jgi:hypothetical protein
VNMFTVNVLLKYPSVFKFIRLPAAMIYFMGCDSGNK